MDYGAANHGRIFHEYLGEVIIKMDGMEKQRWDVAQLFKDVEVTDPHNRGEQLLNKWKEWKVDAAEKRKLLGLRVLE